MRQGQTCFQSFMKEIFNEGPQRSVLDPQLFLIYINDLAVQLKLLYLMIFADDQSINQSIMCLLQLNNVQYGIANVI